MLFRFESVTKSYGAYEVLRGCSFQINPGEKVGLVGRNGAGKTTIFKLLLGHISSSQKSNFRQSILLKSIPEGYLEHHDSGEIACAGNLSVGLLAQQHYFDAGGTVLESAMSVFAHLRKIESQMKQLEHEMAESQGARLEEALELYSQLQHRYEIEGGFTASARAEAVLLGLGFTKDDLRLSVTHLSGGQKSRLGLAKLLLGEPDILLLDEPTNHLDIQAVEWLEEFLSSYRSAYVIISHDRFMLDRVTSRILDLENGRVTSYAGNYTYYVEEKELRQRAQQAAYEQQQAVIERTEEFIRRNIAGQKTRQAKSRRKMLEKLERLEAVQESVSTARFDIRPVARSGDIALTVKDLAIGYPTRILASQINLQLRRGEALAIVGGNGTGKTTLLKTLLHHLEPLSGEVRWGANVQIGYYDQQMADLNPSSRIIDEIRQLEPNAEELKLRSFLATFNFRGEDVYKKVSSLSGGERGRLVLARLVYSRVNVLVLDEPTNHLDINSRDALESALESFTGTILVVSHDRYFLDRIATGIVYLDGFGAEFFNGTYSEYMELRRQRAEAEQQQRALSARTAKVALRQTKTKTSHLRKPDEIEQEITETERFIAELSSALASVETARDPERLLRLQQEYEQLNERLAQLYQEWEASILNSELHKG